MRRQQKKGVLKMPYLNLKGEMAKRNVHIEDISKLLDLHRNSVATKLTGSLHFQSAKRLRFVIAFFKGEDIEYLFKKE